MNILGAKKGQQQAQKPHIAKDDLTSVERFHGLYGLAEGEIYGLADGGKSIKLDGTPLINANGTPNFSDVSWEFRTGTQDQSYIAGFPSVENETRVGVELRSDTPFVRAITNRELSAVRIRLNFNALREQKDNGDITGYAIEYAFDVQIENGAFVEVLRDSVRGKSSSGFKKSHRINLPNAGTAKRWTIRVRRLTANRNSELIGDIVHIDAITEIIDAKLRYPNTALFAVTYNAKTFSNVAKIALRLKGKIIQVPTNYDPVTRTYTGLWDGRFKMAYSNNPAWVFYDLCTHKRYGLGERLSGLVDKWRLYQIGQYCDEPVSDGKGGTEPRFAINVYIQKADDAYRVLQNIASTFRGMSFWDGSQIVLDSDTPKDPVYTFSPANVVGEFVYQGTRSRDRHNFVRVAWDNPDNNYQTEYEPVSDDEAIAKDGVRTLEINAFGCTSQGQAQRAGKWALKAEQLETQTVSFKTGLMGFIPQVGQVINIADNVFAGRAVSGRILAVNSKQITLDRTAGKVGDTLTVNTGGEVQTAKIVSVRGDTLTLDKAVGQVDDVWAVISDDLKLMQFRILTIAQNDDATFDITALEYNAQKYAVVDNGASIAPQPFTVLKATPIHAPNSVTLTATNRTVQGQAVTTLNINWEQVTGAVAYIVEWRKDDGNWQTLPKVSGQSVDIDGIYVGKYTARVRAVDSYDNESLATTSQLTNIAGKTGKPPRLTSLTVQGILFGMNLGWAFARGSDDTNFTEIQVSPDGRSNITTLGTFAYPTNKHEITGLQGGLTQFYRARIVDKLGNASDWTVWVRGVTDNQAEKVLNLISGQIAESHLHQTLSTPIAKIGGLETDLNGVKTQIPTIRNEIANAKTSLQSAIDAVNSQLPTLNGQIATLNSKATTLQNELNTAKNTLQTAVSNITTERNRITSAIRDIAALQSANTAKTQEIANLTQTVNGHTSQVRELAVTTGDLSQKYSQLKTATDTANSEITAIKQTQSGQANSIERLGAKFDDLAVGGRNYFVKKSSHQAWLGDNGGLNSSHTQHITSDYILLNDVAHLILQLWLTVTQENNPNIWYSWLFFDGQKNIIPQSYFAKNEARVPTIPFDVHKVLSISVPENAKYFRFSARYLENGKAKVEIGNIATDWTPAPEDLQADIDSKATTANLETLRQTLTNADTALAQQITAMDTAYKSADRTLTANLASETTARTSADTALGQRIDTLQTDYNGNKASVANQLQTLSDKDTATASQISSLTANVTTAQNTANTANGKADTATTKADNAQRTANDAVSRANTANSAITAEQKARADADTALGQRITAIDTAYKSADSQTTAKLGQLEQSISDKDRAMTSRVDTLNANYTALDNRTKWVELTAVTDLNTLTETGKYFIRASSNPNAPFTQWTYVVVEKARNDRITQTAWADNNASLVYTRVYNGAWQAWEKTATGKELDTKASTASLNEFKQTSANADTALSERITALDTAYKSADSSLTARLAREETARANGDNANAQALRTLESTVQGVNGRLGTSESKIATLERTTSDTNQALATAQSQLNARFDGLAVGGRNLLKNSSPNITNATYGHRFELTVAPNVGDDVIITLWGDMGADRTGIGVYNTQGFTELFRLVKIADGIYQGKGRWRKPVRNGQELTPNDTHLNVYFYPNNATSSNRIERIKLEKGNVPTDWTPAPEDTQSQLGEKASTATLNEFKQTSANADTALGERISAIDTAYKQADTATNAKLANAEKTISDNNTALSQRITALDTAYKSADNNLTARLAREETARASGDNANSQAIRTLESTVQGIGGRVGTSESKIATLERTASDTNQALATAQSELNARFDNLKIGGRNLIIGSQVSRTTHGTTNLTISQNIDFGNVTHLVLSCDVRFVNAQRATTQGARWFRIGAEIRLNWTDGTSNWYGAWRSNVMNGTSFDGRVEHKIAIPTGKTLQAIDSVKIQIWDITGENMLVKNPKLELGTIATDWTPAPEDVNVDLSPYATTASLNEFKQTQASQNTATTQKLSQLESGLGTKANTTALDSLTTKVNQVDGKITAEAQKVSTLQTTVQGQTASIQQHAQSLNGLSAQWTLKVQSGNIVSGIGLASNNGVSDFAVRADKFYIAPPTGTGKGDTPFTVLTSPQVINGVRVPAGTYIRSAYIQDGSITNAKLANASIDNAKIVNASIDSVKIRNGAVGSLQLQDGAVTSAKIGHLAVDTLNIANEAVIVPRALSAGFKEWDRHIENELIFSATMDSKQSPVVINFYAHLSGATISDYYNAGNTPPRINITATHIGSGEKEYIVGYDEKAPPLSSNGVSLGGTNSVSDDNHYFNSGGTNHYWGKDVIISRNTLLFLPKYAGEYRFDVTLTLKDSQKHTRVRLYEASILLMAVKR